MSLFFEFLITFLCINGIWKMSDDLHIIYLKLKSKLKK
jgi:hypothetical protein